MWPFNSITPAPAVKNYLRVRVYQDSTNWVGYMFDATPATVVELQRFKDWFISSTVTDAAEAFVLESGSEVFGVHRNGILYYTVERVTK
jgi:hypothetical protein